MREQLILKTRLDVAPLHIQVGLFSFEPHFKYKG